MNFSQAKDQILVGLLSIGVGIFAWIGISITDLNKNIAEIVVSVKYHKEELDKHDQRIRVLERGE